jgi:hypothetical protein
MSAVDDLNSEHYRLEAPPAQAVAQLEQVLPAPNRVTVERTDDLTLVATTTKHTPAWAFIGLIPLLFVRRNREATLVAKADGSGTMLRTNGRLDHAAARRMRELAVAN